MLESVLDKIGQVCSQIIVVTGKGYDLEWIKSRYNIKQVEDVEVGVGPLCGLYSGLLASNDEFNFVTGCDMPFLNTRLVRWFLSEVGDNDVVAGVVNGEKQTLHAVYSKNCIPEIEKLLSSGRASLKSLLREVKTRLVPESELKIRDPELRSFYNINTSIDLLNAQEFWQF
jgi:molybdopterin-guanine dinucleotide biosynthesis protein A